MGVRLQLVVRMASVVDDVQGAGWGGPEDRAAVIADAGHASAPAAFTKEGGADPAAPAGAQGHSIRAARGAK